MAGPLIFVEFTRTGRFLQIKWLIIKSDSILQWDDGVIIPLLHHLIAFDIFIYRKIVSINARY